MLQADKSNYRGPGPSVVERAFPLSGRRHVVWPTVWSFVDGHNSRSTTRR